MAHSSSQTFLVTGALGCIGAWTVYHLVKRGERVVSFDLGDSRHRLAMLLTPAEQNEVTFVRGDLSDTAQILEAFKAHQITHVIHLAALQVPFCKVDPVKGALVNVVGTVNVFESARQTGVAHLTYASSIAVYGPPEDYPSGPIPHDAPLAPTTLYGVYKQADEGIARVYWQDHHISSTTLRAYTVYGVGRDQGLTSDPTKAMLAAAAGQPFHINFGGSIQLQWASDVALQFIEAAEIPLMGAQGFNLGGERVTIDQVVDAIRVVIPDARITHAEGGLPFPESFDDTELRRHFQTIYTTPVSEGVRQTIQHFQACLADGRVQPPASR
ncbi:MAG TPA: NAD-dependent epimerase/dehydratase [Aggregatilineales bacterium]|nr:NAD-dependent epimerase/dehydratase [Aggregatilineales bacterium]